MAEDGNLLSDATIKRLAIMMRAFFSESTHHPRIFRRRYEVDTEWEGQIVTVNAAPSNGWTGATTCTVQTYELDPSSSSTPQAMRVTSMSPLTVVNRDPSLTPIAGKYCRIRRINGNWMFTWIGC